MNSISWELARRAVIESGLTDFTDGDIIRKYHEMESLAAKASDDAAKAALDAANAVSILDHVVESPKLNTPAQGVAENSGFVNWFGKNIA